MALGAAIWEIRPVNGSDLNGGGFRVDATVTWNTDGVVLTSGVGTGSATFNTASYTFGSGDINSWLYIESHSTVQPNLYKITGVSGGVATIATPLTGCYQSASQGAGSTSSVSWSIDRSQSNTAWTSLTAGSTSITSTVITVISGYTVTVADVGNIVEISSDPVDASPATLGRYSILSVNTTTHTWSLDRTTGAVTAVHAVLRMGGAAATLSTTGPMGDVATNGSGGNKFWLKNDGTGSGAPYSITTSIALNAPHVDQPGSNTLPNRVIGYNATRGDIYESAPGAWNDLSNRPYLQISNGNANVAMLYITTNGWTIENLILDCNNQTSSTGISFAAQQYATFYNLKILNSTVAGIDLSVGSLAIIACCEVTGGSGTALNLTSGGCIAISNYVHDTTGIGIDMSVGGSCAAIGNLVANNTGAGSHGMLIGGTFAMVLQNTVYNSGGSSLYCADIGTPLSSCFVRGNIFSKSGTYGLVGSNASAGCPALPWTDGNAYWSNTSGNRQDLDDGGYGSAATFANPVNWCNPYANVLDVYLSSGSNPFTADSTGSTGGGNLTLNNTVGAGALLRAAAPIGLMPSSNYPSNPPYQSYLDFGALQHQDSGGGGMLYVSNLTGNITG